MSESFQLTIDSIAAGGDGVGRHEGMVVFVPRTAPGDVVMVDAAREGRLMRGRVRDVVDPSQSRVPATCAHYDGDRCGGCQLQHLSYESQLAAKAAIIRDSLQRIGGRSVELPVVERSDPQWRYRTKLTLALRRRGGRWLAGMHPHDAPGDVFTLDDCHITDAGVLTHWSAVLAHGELLPGERQLRASVRRIDDGFALVVEGGSAWPTSEALFTAVETMRELWWQPAGGARVLLHSRESGAGASFTQVNPAVAARLLEWVFAIAGRRAPASAVDGYAGTGDIALGLARLGVRTTAIEIDRDAAAVCAGRLPAGSRAVAASVESALGRELPADLVVLNPPRAGLHASIPRLLQAESREPKAVVYVSCDPGTLARDLKRLDRYHIRSIRGFDMFPQTAHVETVCELDLAA